MRLHFPTSCIRVAALLAAASYAVGVHAAALPTAPQTLATDDQQGQYQFVRRGNEGEMLREAYGILERADHDYKGHRAKAMHEIEAAGKLIGMNVRGDGKGHERQAVSDTQLRHAQELLEQVSNSVAGQKKVHNHLSSAINHLSIALKIK